MPLEDRAGLPAAARVVVKVGSSSLTAPDGGLDVESLRRLTAVLAACRARGQQIVLVSSGAIAAGLGPLGLTGRPRDLATAQAAAAAGQGLLVARYTEAFARHGQRVAQVLLTAEDLIRRQHHVNAQRALERLLALGVLPIVNENDAVATDEIRFGDNDRLAALVSHLVRADAMVLLTDVDGLYDGPPSRSGSRLVSEVTSPADIDGIEVGGRGTEIGTGGMVTKLEAASIATSAGIPVLLTSAANAAVALDGGRVGTWFAATDHRTSTRRLWLAHAARTHGRVYVDDGAVHALTVAKRSLLAAGITAVEGEFEPGDPIEIAAPGGTVIARGLVSYAAGEVRLMQGKTSARLTAETGQPYPRPVVHRDDLVVRDRRR